VPIIAFSPDEAIRRRLSLYWGVVPKVMDPVENDELMVEMVSGRLIADRHAQNRDRVVLVYGSTLGVSGQTNSIRLYRIGDRASARP
jgi:pyruvate kinase